MAKSTLFHVIPEEFKVHDANTRVELVVVIVPDVYVKVPVEYVTVPETVEFPDELPSRTFELPSVRFNVIFGVEASKETDEPLIFADVFAYIVTELVLKGVPVSPVNVTLAPGLTD